MRSSDSPFARLTPWERELADVLWSIAWGAAEKARAEGQTARAPRSPVEPSVVPPSSACAEPGEGEAPRRRSYPPGGKGSHGRTGESAGWDPRKVEILMASQKEPAKRPNAERGLRGRIGAEVYAATHSQEEINARMEKARAGKQARLEHAVDPDGVLPEAERQRRADALHKAEMARLALKSAQARTTKPQRAAEHARPGRARPPTLAVAAPERLQAIAELQAEADILIARLSFVLERLGRYAAGMDWMKANHMIAPGPLGPDKPLGPR